MKTFTIYLADGKILKSDKTLVMGILNATPDSFSDGGELDTQAKLDRQVARIIESGADILDVGGESTRPGHKKIELKEEIDRILPVIKSIRKISKSIPISIDTQKAAVAEAALETGASFINDVSALGDKRMAGVAKRFGCSIILMRGRSTGRDPVSGCKKQFEEITRSANEHGLNKDRLILDPGLGFGDFKSGNYKSSPGSDPQANIMLILNIPKYSLGFPVLIGASRKRFIGDLTGAADAKDRLSGSLAMAIMAKQSGAAIIRVHDVDETVKALSA